MAKVTATIPQGTRDFGPDTVRKRNYIFDTIRNVFELYGFEPLETPAMENLETLMGKYGEEGDKLIFKILNNGEYLSGLRPEDFEGIALGNLKSIPFRAEANINNIEYKKKYNQITNHISSRALKYDLTIPFARYVAMNHNQLTFPFKRYQIQPVWRADRPQKGRYREFYQCDADVVGSYSLLNEVELISIYIKVFEHLKIGTLIKINNRKILQGVAEYCGCPDKLIELTTSLDKLDKIGFDKVKSELISKGIPADKVALILECLTINENELTEEMCLDCVNISKQFLNIEEQKIACLKYKFWKNEIISGMTGCDELLKIFDLLDKESLLKFDVSLARGLNYYTGIIIEVKAKDVQIGSIGGGGRYDDLTGLFGVPDIPGVGISFGVDRIYDVMEELNLFPADVHVGTQVLFFNLGETESRTAFRLMQQLRSNDIRSELYHEQSKFDKQFKYAEKKSIPYIIIIGDKELKENTCTIKNLTTGQQQTIAASDLINYTF